MNPSQTRLENFAKEIGYSFGDFAHLELALLHASAGAKADNERLEFLGDRVLGLVVADRLLKQFPKEQEGALARRLNSLVRKETCADVAREIGLGDQLTMDEAEARSGGRDKTAILGNACEALIAAIFLDGGLRAAGDFIDRFWGDRLALAEDAGRDPKTALQEWAHRAHGLTPKYEVLSKSGPDHAPVFAVTVSLGDLMPTSGEGSSKRAAEQAAAKAMLEREGADQ